MKPTLLLDVDGVIMLDGQEFDSLAMNNLQRLSHAVGAQTVLTTTWRLTPSLRAGLVKTLGKIGIKPIGDTPDFRGNFGQTRKDEIRHWMTQNPSCLPIVLDDQHDAHIGDGFYQTCPQRGLDAITARHVVRDVEWRIKMSGRLQSPNFDRLMCARKWMTEACYLKSSNRHETAFLALWMALEAISGISANCSPIHAQFKPVRDSLAMGSPVKNIEESSDQFDAELATLLDAEIHSSCKRNHETNLPTCA